MGRIEADQRSGEGVWADTADRSKKNEVFLAGGMFTSHVHQKRKPRRPLPERIARANIRRSKIRAQVEHVFAGQKHRMGLSCAPSVSPGPPSRSEWPTLPITSSASPGWGAYCARLMQKPPPPRRRRRHGNCQEYVAPSGSPGSAVRAAVALPKSDSSFEVSSFGQTGFRRHLHDHSPMARLVA